MLLKELLRGLDYEWLQGKNIEVEDIVIDSRRVRIGSMFICTIGKKTDSHEFIEAAAREGACAIVIQTPRESYPPNAAIIKVENTRKAMSIIAANYYYNPCDAFNLIGVTGTNGKTSVTYFIESILQEFAHKVGLIGTVDIRAGSKKIEINNPTATTPDPIPLQNLFSIMKEERVNDVVMEVSSHALALDKLEGVKFQIGVFMNLTQDHLDFHGSMENYAEAKGKLFMQCKYGVANRDDKYFKAITRGAKCELITFGIDSDYCDYKASGIEYLEKGVSFNVNIKGNEESFFVPIKAKFTVYNGLASIAAGMAMNIPVDVIKRGLARVKGIPGRIQSVPNDRGFHVIVDYAHSPDSLVNIISSVREFTKGRLIIIFGCGGNKDKTKRPIMGKVAGELSDYCIITSDNPRDEDPEVIISEAEVGVIESHCPYEKITDRRAAILRGIEMMKSGDSLIIAGKGHENYQELKDETIYFDDVEVAESALKQIC